MARLWRFDTTIDTDVLAPGFYMKKPLEELAPIALRRCGLNLPLLYGLAM